jgi:SHS family lactate transporter-like MFS transporter
MATTEITKRIPWWKEPTQDQWLAWWAAWLGWTFEVDPDRATAGAAF